MRNNSVSFNFWVSCPYLMLRYINVDSVQTLNPYRPKNQLLNYQYTHTQNEDDNSLKS